MWVHLIAMPCVHLLGAQAVMSACWFTTHPASRSCWTLSLWLWREKAVHACWCWQWRLRRKSSSQHIGHCDPNGWLCPDKCMWCCAAGALVTWPVLTHHCNISWSRCACKINGRTWCRNMVMFDRHNQTKSHNWQQWGPSDGWTAYWVSTSYRKEISKLS